MFLNAIHIASSWIGWNLCETIFVNQRNLLQQQLKKNPHQSKHWLLQVACPLREMVLAKFWGSKTNTTHLLLHIHLTHTSTRKLLTFWIPGGKCIHLFVFTKNTANLIMVLASLKCINTHSVNICSAWYLIRDFRMFILLLEFKVVCVCVFCYFAWHTNQH